MRWRGGRQSGNIVDRRGMGGLGGLGGGMGGMRIAGGGIGAVVLVVIAMLFGVDPSMLLQGGSTQDPAVYGPQSGAPNTVDDEAEAFVATVLADTEDTWKGVFRQQGGTYREPRLVLFTGAVQSACGFAQAAVGPFYCPGDEQVYIDPDFFRELQTRFAAPGDFAEAYVIAHEIGHHVQKLMGITDQVERAGGGRDNALSVRLELQADCFAGLWAHNADRSRQILESGDVEEGLNAAAAVGDDRLQMQSRGYVAPESFTHGSSAQRARWFRRGLESGELSSCDTFNAAQL